MMNKTLYILILLVFSLPIVTAGFDLCEVSSDYCTYTMGGWGSPPQGDNPGQLLSNYFDNVFPDGLVVGVGYNLTFTSSEAVQNFLPEGGQSNPLNQSYVNPDLSQSSFGNLAGQITALKLNVFMSEAAYNHYGHPEDISNLIIGHGKFGGLTVSEFLEVAEKYLGGDTSILNTYGASGSDVASTADSINNNFVECEVNNNFLFEPCPISLDCVAAIEQGYLYGDIESDTITIFNDWKEPFDVGLAVYKKYDYYTNWETQVLYDYELSVVQPGESVTLSVNLPYCNYQIDAFCGELLPTLSSGNLYGNRKIDWEHSWKGPPYCVDGLTCAQAVEQDFLNAFIDDSTINITNGINETYEIGVVLTKHFQDSNLTTKSFYNAPEGLTVIPYEAPDCKYTLEVYCSEDEECDKDSKLGKYTADHLPLCEEEEPVLGNLKVCKIIFNEYDEQVTGVGLNANFTLPFANLSGAFFETPLSYVNDNNCVVYSDLELGTYEFSDEIIQSSRDDLIWSQPEYSVSGFEITLTEEDPNATLIVTNQFKIEEEDPLTIKAYKVVCEDESYLPNWGVQGSTKPSMITNTTAQDFVDQNSAHCWIEEDWEFQYGFNAASKPGDFIGFASSGWQNFSSATTLTEPAKVEIESLVEGSILWVREVLQEGYVPFSAPPGSLQQVGGAEFYCHRDILNFDNLERIDDPELGETYYCVAFNVPEKDPEPVFGGLKVCKELFNETNHLVTGEGLNTSFTIPFSNLSDPVFRTPLNYSDGLDCVLYDGLDLGVYEFGDEIIMSSRDDLIWSAPVYSLAEIELTEKNPNKTLIVTNQFEVEEPEPVLGNITVCKELFNETGDLVTGVDLDANFTLPITGLGDAFFSTPLTYNQDGLSCVVYADLELGSYEFRKEIIESEREDLVWSPVQYSIAGFEITLTEELPSQTLIVTNQFMIEEEPEPVLGNLTICKELLNESGDLVTGVGLDATFKIPLYGLSDAVFNTPLTYGQNGLECIVYEDLQLGTYEFAEELISSSDPLVNWSPPQYSVEGWSITLTEELPSQTLIVTNQFEVEEPEPVLGNLKVCKELFNESGYKVSGEELNANFTLPFANLSSAFFETPLSYANDENCVVYGDLELGVYEFGDEIIQSSREDLIWSAPVYSLAEIVLTEENPTATLVVTNQFEVEEPEPVLGELTVCKELFNETGDLVTGVGLEANFTIPFNELQDAFFETPLSYANDENCVLYSDLDLGNYDFSEEVIESNDSLVNWSDPEYSIQGWSITLTEQEPHKTLTVTNKFKMDEPEPVLGNITVCKVLLNETGDKVSGEELDANFTIPFNDLQDAFFETPLSFAADIDCLAYTYLSLGTYEFSEEIIESSNPLVEWLEVDYSIEGFEIELTEEQPNQTLIITNQFKIKEEEPILGSLTICKRLYNETNDLVTGKDLNTNFTIPFTELKDAVFKTPLNYTPNLECQKYNSLELGTYEFGKEIIQSTNPLIHWFNETYNVEGWEIELTESNPDKVLIVTNQFKMKEPLCTELNISQPVHYTDNATYIDTKTLLNISVNKEDEVCVYGEHKFRFEQVPIESCYNPYICSSQELMNEWSDASEFQLSEEGCYAIEHYTEFEGYNTSITRECIVMDKTPPVLNKTVGTPKTEFSGENPGFYPEAEEACWSTETGVECWKVTLNTPISVSCIDEGDFQSGLDRIEMKLSWDGDDITQKYCDEYNGLMVDGSCVFTNNFTFTFLEESWHKLELICYDNVNKSSSNTQYYKVQGRTFELIFNKKWNLFSIPAPIQNHELNEIFKDEHNVSSIWSYDAETETWKVWTPEGPSNLEFLEVGKGYWMLALDYFSLELALKAGLFPPTQQKIYHGWNLVGYYGTESLLSMEGPTGQGKTAECNFQTLHSSINDIPWTTLYTYWEPDNPDQWMSLGKQDRMDPGMGYWLFATKDNIYAPSTC